MWAAVVSLVLAGAASASVKQGDTELEFLGGFTTQNGESGGADFESWFVSPAIGYFVTDNVQVQGAAIGIWSETELDLVAGAPSFNVDVDVLGLGGRVKYHFMPTNQWVPYIGAQLMWIEVDVDVTGTSSLEGDSDGTLWGPLAGLRYELNDNNDFFVEYQYQVWEGDVGSLWEDGHLLVLGISHQFK